MNINALTAYLALSSGSYRGILRDMYAVYNLGLNPDLHTKLLANRFVGVTEELSGTPPLSFTAKGKPLTAWSITGNTVQDGTPTPENPVEVLGCGDYDSETGLYKIPVVTRGNEQTITTPIYLDSPLYKIEGYADRLSTTEEVSIVKELVLTGEEVFGYANSCFTYTLDDKPTSVQPIKTVIFSNVYEGVGPRYRDQLRNYQCCITRNFNQIAIRDNNYADAADFKSYLAAQYAAGTPVKVYYVMQTPKTKTVEPVEIPTLNGTTVIDVDTAVKPESMTIKYRR